MVDFELRVKKFMSNPLLCRKQFAVEILHPGKAPIAKQAIREEISKIYKVNDLGRIIVGGFNCPHGGNHSMGFGRIYDSIAAAKKFELNYRLARLGIAEKKTPAANRRQKKDIRTRKKKVRGVAKAKVSGGKK